MKRIAFCFDGTWNKLHAANATNVVLVAESIFPTAADGIIQVIHYDDGVGTGGDDWKWKQSFEKFTGGILGWGLLDNIREAYRFLIFNYEPGDEIYVFGFSRGAYTARSFVGLLRCASILQRKDASQINNAVEFYRNRRSKDPAHLPNLRRFRAKYAPHICVSADEDKWRVENFAGYASGSSPLLTVRYLGVWDTVGALGLPERIPGAERFNARHQFHDPELPSFVESARHAVALDERRRTFAPTMWDNVALRNAERGHSAYSEDAPIQQQWFPGTHGSVGGGGDIRGLSDGALNWVIEGAKRQGLELDTSTSSRIYETRPDHRAPLVNDSEGVDLFTRLSPKKDREGPTELHEVHVSARRRWFEDASNLPEKEPYRPKSLGRVAAELDKLTDYREVTYTGPVLITYVIEPGDTLTELSHRFYGDRQFHEYIFDANRAVLDNPHQLTVGSELIIPSIEGLVPDGGPVSPPGDRPSTT